jgi:hypothetical protein
MNESQLQMSALLGVPVWCGRGWTGLLTGLHDTLLAEFPNARLWEVKEKFGQLRIYAELPRDADENDKARLGGLLRDVEDRSATICELCGQPGTLSTEAAWISTLCPEHRELHRSDLAAFIALRRAVGA